MENIYYELVKAGNRTIKQVPVNLRTAVQALLDADAATIAEDINYVSD